MSKTFDSDTLTETAPIGVFRTHADGELEYANPYLLELLGFEDAEAFAAADALSQYVDPADGETVAGELAQTGRVRAFETRLFTRDDQSRDVVLHAVATDDHVEGFIEDVTDQRHRERQLQEITAEVQKLSLPVVEIWDRMVLATVVGTLDTDRAENLTENLLEKIEETQAAVALVDITGVPSIDTATAQHLIDTINAVNLLGSRVIITGMNPQIAQTLVHLGIPLTDIETRSSLVEGLKSGIGFLEEVAAGNPGAP